MVWVNIKEETLLLMSTLLGKARRLTPANDVKQG
jgi:hypothetical protein